MAVWPEPSLSLASRRYSAFVFHFALSHSITLMTVPLDHSNLLPRFVPFVGLAILLFPLHHRTSNSDSVIQKLLPDSTTRIRASFDGGR